MQSYNSTCRARALCHIISGWKSSFLWKVPFTQPSLLSLNSAEVLSVEQNEFLTQKGTSTFARSNRIVYWTVKHMPVTSCALSGHILIQIFLLPHTKHTAQAAGHKHAALRVSRHEFGGYHPIVSAALKLATTNCQQGLRG